MKNWNEKKNFSRDKKAGFETSSKFPPRKKWLNQKAIKVFGYLG
jgi:hypothetical protein